MGLVLGLCLSMMSPAADVEANLQKALSGIYDGNDGQALSALSEIEAGRPAYPAPAVYRSLLAYWRAAADPGNPALVAKFRDASTEAIRRSTAWVDGHREDAEAWRLLASALGQRSQFSIAVAPNTGDIVRYGMKARDAVFRAHALDESDKDILIGMGATNYFTANLPWYIKPMAYTLGIRGGNRELGLKQVEQGMNEGPHSKVEGAMVLAGAMYSEARYREFYQIMTQHITSPYPTLLPAVSWTIGGSLCGGMTVEATRLAGSAVADERWKALQRGRIALAGGKWTDAETAFTQAIGAISGNQSNLAWAYYGRALARTRGGKKGAGDMNRSKQVSPAAFALAERQFENPVGCRP